MKAWTVGLVVAVVALGATSGQAGAGDATAGRLVASWKDADPNMRTVAETIASAFVSGLVWGQRLGGTPMVCLPDSTTGREALDELDQYLANHNPSFAQHPYGEILSAALVVTFPCRHS
jgi:hypothetical protein